FAERPEEFIVEVQGNTAIPLMMRQESADMTTYVLTGDKDSPVLVPVEDPMMNIGEEATLRLANFGQRDVALYVGALPEEMELLLENASPGEVTEYADIPAGRYFADLRSDEGGTILARIPTLQMRSGILYSLYVIGTAEEWKGVLVVDGASYLPYTFEK
ncbi:MAG: DUF4397 domain-containing protein, partial [Firmicutes bacterium]|nr:DUF4397 domain-containing protein [Bacillota bacterium]